MEDIDHYEIPIYNFPYDIEEDDEETIADNTELRVCLFFQFYFQYLIFWSWIGLTTFCCDWVRGGG